MEDVLLIIIVTTIHSYVTLIMKMSSAGIT